MEMENPLKMEVLVGTSPINDPEGNYPLMSQYHPILIPIKPSLTH